jgi:hypothetical protein
MQKDRMPPGEPNYINPKWMELTLFGASSLHLRRSSIPLQGRGTAARSCLRRGQN